MPLNAKDFWRLFDYMTFGGVQAPMRRGTKAQSGLQVLEGLFNMGCRGLTDDLDLSKNDLDDSSWNRVSR